MQERRKFFKQDNVLAMGTIKFILLGIYTIYKRINSTL